MKDDNRKPARQDGVNMDKRDSLRSLSRLGAGALGAAAVAGPAVLMGQPNAAHAGQVCQMTPVGLQGPFYVNLNKIRTDLRENRAGARLDLCLTLVDTKTCKPYKNAVLDIWACDAGGNYSGYPYISPDVPGYTPVPLGQMPLEAPQLPPATPEAFCRGSQVTDSRGEVRFTTIYPSWYATRTPHVHVKVYLQLPTTGQTAVFTSQMYFDEATNTQVLARSEYQGRTVARDTYNNTDRHFVAMSGNKDILKIRKTLLGYEGSLVLGVTLT